MNGPTVSGTDGTDFTHREKVASHYKISVANKSRLKTCFFLQLIMTVVMFVKLLSDILDKLDIFILEIEELEIPPPLWWEYIWFISSVFLIFGNKGIQNNNITYMTIYMVGSSLWSFMPVLYAMILYWGDVWQVLSDGSYDGLHVWQGYPYGVMWYVFLVPTFQVHLFSTMFSVKLYNTWLLKKKSQ